MAYLESAAQVLIWLYHLENTGSSNVRGQLWRRYRARENLGFLGAEDLLDSAIRHDMFLVLFLGFLSRRVRIAPQQKERGCHSGFHEPT